MQSVARHLAVCEKCEAELVEFAAIGERLREIIGEPTLEGFTQSVMARLPRPTPIRNWLRGFLDLFNERLIAGTALGAATLAIGAWTMILVTPLAQNFVARARVDRSSLLVSAKAQARGLESVAKMASLGHHSRAVISRLESKMPSVAVWSEPDTEATVIWVPDER
jgi:anti-sigma factor RsiW